MDRTQILQKEMGECIAKAQATLKGKNENSDAIAEVANDIKKSLHGLSHEVTKRCDNAETYLSGLVDHCPEIPYLLKLIIRAALQEIKEIKELVK